MSFHRTSTYIITTKHTKPGLPASYWQNRGLDLARYSAPQQHLGTHNFGMIAKGGYSLQWLIFYDVADLLLREMREKIFLATAKEAWALNT